MSAPHRCVGAGSDLSRRAVLTALGAVGVWSLAGCAVGGPASAGAHASAAAAPTPTTTPSSTSSSTPRSTPTPTPTRTAEALDPAAVAARYAGESPTAFGLDLPGIRQTLLAQPAGPAVALTFDACGGRGGSRVDERLLDTLRSAQVPATLFLNARWIDANAGEAAALAADPLFRIGNHGTRHVPLTVAGQAAYGIAGTASAAEAVDEVCTSARAIAALTGRPPVMFRPGTAFYDDVGVRIARDLGVEPIGFAVNGDAGATFPARTVRAVVGSAAAGSIVIAHMNRPGSGTADGIAGAIADLRARGIGFAHVDTAPVGTGPGGAHPALSS